MYAGRQGDKVTGIACRLNMFMIYAPHGFLLFVGSFFTRRVRKEPTKNVKYHAAAGESCLLRKL
jgi:hypothetical protein